MATIVKQSKDVLIFKGRRGGEGALTFVIAERVVPQVMGMEGHSQEGA